MNTIKSMIVAIGMILLDDILYYFIIFIFLLILLYYLLNLKPNIIKCNDVNN